MKLLICGASGFIGKNLVERFSSLPGCETHAVMHKTPLHKPGVRAVHADLTRAEDVARAVKGMDVVLQAAAVTSGAKDIATRPHIHVADNAVMNSLLLRACHDHKVGHVVFFSCTVMYPSGPEPVRETDFDGRISDPYFGVGWTKVYAEKLCEFYSRLGRVRHTVIRHSNIYGPHDKFDLERSHVFGATVAKVLGARDGRVVVWGEGTEERDLLYVDDLADFVQAAVARQKTPFELLNVGSGSRISVAELVRKVIARSGRDLRVEFDAGKPTIPFSLSLDCGLARERFGWTPKTPLDAGIDRTLEWVRKNVPT
ncbi:MAG: NAD-dependent epimerase/dehydratase family protein [Elusimicrobiota bacterium]